MTIAEAMAMAVIKGDHLAAYALAADLLREQQDNPSTLAEYAAKLVQEKRSTPASSFAVYRWPEFQAFARRLGFGYDLYTRDVVIRLPADGLVVIEHDYMGRDTGPNQDIEFTEDEV